MLELQEKPDCFLKKSEYKKEKERRLATQYAVIRPKVMDEDRRVANRVRVPKVVVVPLLTTKIIQKQPLVSLLRGNVLARIATV